MYNSRILFFCITWSFEINWWIIAIMAYYWFPTKEDKNYWYILSFLFFWGHLTVSLHIQQVYWVTIFYYNHCPFVTANANGNNIYHLKKSQVFFFFLLNRNLYFGSWCATRLKQQNYKTVYLTQYVDEICICFIVF